MRPASALPLLLALGTAAPCLAESRHATGTYLGDGTGQREITVGFQPSAVLAQANSRAFLWTASMATGSYKTLTGGIGLQSGTTLRGFTPTGFVVGGAHNSLGTTYHYLALSADPAELAEGQYVGDGLSGHAIPVGFAPDGVIVMAFSSAPVDVRTATMPAGSNLIFSQSAYRTSAITAFTATGFEVGTAVSVNEAGITFYYLAWRSRADRPQGSYSGTGAPGIVPTPGTYPQWASIVGLSEDAVFRNDEGDRAADVSRVYSGSTITNAISALLPDGFALGTAREVNRGGGTYHWFAFGSSLLPDGGLPDGGVPPFVDAGIADGGSADGGGAPDAGTPDAGLDAGEVDAGEGDGGLAEADAGAPDGGGGGPDAGTPDGDGGGGGGGDGDADAGAGGDAEQIHVRVGCGCGSAPMVLSPVLLLLFALRARGARRPGGDERPRRGRAQR